jgi:hypothetical protein
VASPRCRDDVAGRDEKENDEEAEEMEAGVA